MEVTIYNLVGPLGVVHSYTDKDEAEWEAKNRFNTFGDRYSVEETALTVSAIFLKRIYSASKEVAEAEETEEETEE